MKVSENCLGCLKAPVTPPLVQQYHVVNINVKNIVCICYRNDGRIEIYNIIDFYITNIFEVDLIYVLSFRKLLHFGGIAYSFEKLTYRYILFQQSNM